MDNPGEKLQALLDLIQVDLNDVQPQDKRKLILRAGQITNQDIFLFSAKKLAYIEITRENPAVWDAWNALLEMKKDIMFVVNWILDHKHGFCLYYRPAILRWSPNTKFSEETFTWPEPKETEIILVDSKAPPNEKSSTKTKRIRIESLVVLRFLEDVLSERLKRCLCGKIFVQMTARNKSYHSIKCARRYAAKRSDERKRKEVK